MSDIDPTDHALATIASILESPEAPPETEKFASVDEHPSVDENLVLDEQPLVPEHPADADGYSKLGPGPMEALRFKWTVQRGDEGLYYVHETIGAYSTPVVSGPMSGEAAVQFVDERESEAHQRFEVLRDEIANRSSVADIVRKGEA
ncbi:hypothetical protein NLM33_05290 [Bradyrhizobium sp. CCGUVB1N3]|uniref:hypothetical protein n=1 Tax=Bradyrhizobium sp. CCGUVB1N3 TaxID=2949629 RepID=UPI0020B37D4D|nr:hypothetical protein [Bradyrhizobium sp. CCGUVB1N3]MCP3469743.1 hypothetical protein [Bradyrhizobium sp. CCGUVB1N3]